MGLIMVTPLFTLPYSIKSVDFFADELVDRSLGHLLLLWTGFPARLAFS
jgi:hypothetical protein